MSTTQTPKTPTASLPLLEAGDRLTRAEFERRYEASPRIKKAELLEGVVYVPSPARLQQHGRPHAQILGWLVHYEAGTPGVIAADNATARLDLDNEPQPDALLLIDPERGGQVRISDDDFIEGAPELVVEVAASSVSYDLHVKLNVYRRNGVREYVVWRVHDRQFDWFVLNEGVYDRREPDPDGLYRSTVFPGLWLDPNALLNGDLATVLAALNRGMATPEHAAFLANPPEETA